MGSYDCTSIEVNSITIQYICIFVFQDFIEMNKRTAAATQPRIPRTHSINDLSTTDVIVQGSIGKIPK